MFSFPRFILTFLGVFAFCYGAIQLWIALTSPGGLYSEWIARHFDGITAWRYGLLWSTKQLLGAIGMETHYKNSYVLTNLTGSGIRLVYSCLGFGVMSFWAAYSLAMEATLKQKIYWFLGGLVGLYIINVVRLSMVLYFAKEHAALPYFDHHTWFNIASYILIFFLMFLHYRSLQPTNSSS